jgi:hypothetical protein
MKRLGAVACALLLTVGCAGEDRLDWLDAARKDLNGDRMKLTSETVNPYSPLSGTRNGSLGPPPKTAQLSDD